MILAFFINITLLFHTTWCSTPTYDVNDWRSVEGLAEQHPYIVALLNHLKKYLCTGSIISSTCIVTSGYCVTLDPRYVAVATAVYQEGGNDNNLFEVDCCTAHNDYMYELNTDDGSITKMHSNIGLVFVKRPYLEYFITAADITNTFASELIGQKVIAIGYGTLGLPNKVGLQYQGYQETACVSPKWYYCICGFEYVVKTYSYEFGAGGPVVSGKSLVGVSAAPCGVLSMGNVGIRYNVFTIIGPYLPWMEKNKKARCPSPRDETAVPHYNVVQINNVAYRMKQCVWLRYLLFIIIVSKIFL